MRFFFLGNMASDSTVAGSTLALNNVLQDEKLVHKIREAKLLLVGAGGIGSEVIKTLLLMGFVDIEMIDLDTIDVSNLNRQFLFNKSHVGKSKAEIAAKVAIERFAHEDIIVNGTKKSVDLKPIHNSIMSQDFTLERFRSYTMVINALDNRAARSHVNRMCLAADVPLIESGTEGYLGQVFTIQRGASACFECEGPRQDQKTFASCTIRNTPSLPIHCIVWGKHLFAQLFGEHDADNDVSPDVNDPELTGLSSTETDEAATKPVKSDTTREWAARVDYNAAELFRKFFHKDVEYLLQMEKLWENRKKPIPLVLEELLKGNLLEASCSTVNGSTETVALKDQRVWGLQESFTVFEESLATLKGRLSEEPFLVWDKDDVAALNFVTAVSNFRSFCFSIERKSKFDVKSMAGNIIPAISSTNSIIGGLIGLQVLSLLRKLPDTHDELAALDIEQKRKLFKEACRIIYLRKVSLTHKNLIAGYELFDPNDKCLVCATGRVPEVEIACPLDVTTMIDFVEQIIIGKLHFVCPDVQLDGQAVILYSKDDAEDESEEEKAISRTRTLGSFSAVVDKTRLKVEDLLQNQTIFITLKDEKVEPNENDGLFYKLRVITEADPPKVEEKEEPDTNSQPIDSVDDGPPVLVREGSPEPEFLPQKIQKPDPLDADSSGSSSIAEIPQDLGDFQDEEGSDSDVVCLEEEQDIILLDDDDEDEDISLPENAPPDKRKTESLDCDEDEEVVRKKKRS